MRSSSGISVIVVVMLCAALAACSSTIHDTARIGGYDTLSIDAKQRMVFFGYSPITQDQVVCTEPSPDALVAISAALAAQGSAAIPSETDPTKNDTFNAGGGFSSSETAASIAMRTATVQILRDGYYRLCEGLMNGTIDECDYRAIMGGADSFITTVMAVDAIGGMQRAQTVAVSGGTVSAAANADNAKVIVDPANPVPVEGKPPPLIEVGQITVPIPDEKQAIAIRNIIQAYLHHNEALAPLGQQACE